MSEDGWDTTPHRKQRRPRRFGLKVTQKYGLSFLGEKEWTRTYWYETARDRDNARKPHGRLDWFIKSVEMEDVDG